MRLIVDLCEHQRADASGVKFEFGGHLFRIGRCVAKFRGSHGETVYDDQPTVGYFPDRCAVCGHEMRMTEVDGEPQDPTPTASDPEPRWEGSHQG